MATPGNRCIVDLSHPDHKNPGVDEEFCKQQREKECVSPCTLLSLSTHSPTTYTGNSVVIITSLKSFNYNNVNTTKLLLLPHPDETTIIIDKIVMDTGAIKMV